eukprot:GDKI01003674.1.p2 GENE.GDKI01003674.1~~GDKI01003674.1.p2  ORF type:complete len:118 (-),score=8.79 GDKI01003674.1:35-388(-)
MRACTTQIPESLQSLFYLPAGYIVLTHLTLLLPLLLRHFLHHPCCLLSRLTHLHHCCLLHCHLTLQRLHVCLLRHTLECRVLGLVGLLERLHLLLRAWSSTWPSLCACVFMRMWERQ